MAVVVVTGRDARGNTSASDTYENGGDTTLHGEHLFVKQFVSGSWMTIATYAPRAWLSAAKDNNAPAQ